MIKYFKKIIPRDLKIFFYKKFNVSFSKAGEDLQLKKLIRSDEPGCYIDIGCWDPIKCSNTYYFHLRKWKGLCIDANPDLLNKYRLHRPRDIFCNCGVSNNGNQLDYFILSNPYSSMNSFDQKFLSEKDLFKHVIKKTRVKVRPLSDILDEYILPEDRLDFFDVDVEGKDLEVLESNNWKKYRPKIIMVETRENILNEKNSELYKFIFSQNYTLVAKLVQLGHDGNLFFIANEFI